MRLLHSLLAATLVAGTATAGAAQSDPNSEPRRDRRARVWTELRNDLHAPRPLANFYRYRAAPDRMRIVERSLERSARAPMGALERARSQVERAERIRLHADLRREMVTRERAMERVHERLDRVRDEHRSLIRRRLRTI